MSAVESIDQLAHLGMGLDNFNVDTYLDSRANNPSFVMVEIGHAGLSVAYQQTPGFTGQRAYFGVEAWLRDEWGRQRERQEEQHKALGDGQNIFYIAQELGGVACYDEEDPRYSWYDGEYNPKTSLPDSIADEVFISNVFCDPHVAYSPDATSKLLAEAVCLVDPNGLIVLRETITPGKVGFLTNSLVHTTNLKVEGVARPTNYGIWDKLEEAYNAEPRKHAPSLGSYYLFLSKRVVTA